LWQEENAQSDCQEYPQGVFETFHGAKLRNIADIQKHFWKINAISHINKGNSSFAFAQL
jgi:hypothetical protein